MWVMGASGEEHCEEESPLAKKLTLFTGVVCPHPACYLWLRLPLCVTIASTPGSLTAA